MKEEIINHLNSIYNNLPAFIELIKNAPEERNKMAFIEMVVESRKMDYQIQYHLKPKESGEAGNINSNFGEKEEKKLE